MITKIASSRREGRSRARWVSCLALAAACLACGGEAGDNPFSSRADALSGAAEPVNVAQAQVEGSGVDLGAEAAEQEAAEGSAETAPICGESDDDSDGDDSDDDDSDGDDSDGDDLETESDADDEASDDADDDSEDTDENEDSDDTDDADDEESEDSDGDDDEESDDSGGDDDCIPAPVAAEPAALDPSIR